MTLYSVLGSFLYYVSIPFTFFVAYKLIDFVLRKPRIGQYSERYILVTGCDSGFGQLVARRLDKIGCHVLAGCLIEAGQKELIRSCSRRVKVFELDVSNHDSVLRAYDFVKSKLPNGKSLWGILNNAGVSGKCGPNEWLKLDDYREVLNVNLLGLIDVTMTFLPLIKKSRGRIVNTSCVMGRITLPGSAPYCVSKYGVESFTDGLRRSLRDYGCKVILIEPGFHKTPLIAEQALKSLFSEAWNQASPEVKTEFGEDYFQYHFRTVYERYDWMASGRIEDVVDAYEHALLACIPRVRYVVGTDALLLWLPLQWMPEWFSDHVLWRMERNSSAAPVRAAHKKNN